MTGSKLTSTTPRARQRCLSIPQSKNGCFTCRARRKKCGEEKPACKRCVQAGRSCEGYRSDEHRGSSGPVCLNRPVSARPFIDQATARFSHLGQELLLRQVCPGSLAVGAKIWTIVLPQLSVVNTCVNAAVVCLGAVYESLVLRRSLDVDLISPHYRKAISQLQHEISSHAHGKIPIFLTCVVLAAVEVLQRHLINAMVHLRGAFKLLTTHVCVTEEDRTLYSIAQAFDIQRAAYALSQPPDLPSTYSTPSASIAMPIQHTGSLDDLHSELLPFLHACYHYCCKASGYKYRPSSEIPQLVILDQGRYIALLSQWIARLDHGLAALPSSISCERQSQVSSYLMLRLQCISATIYLSSVLNPFEKGYDSYVNFFQQIVQGAASILNYPQPGILDTSANRFRLLSPLAQPLFLTAMKCRNSQVRQESIRLLRFTGREGPWDSAILVRVAARIAELEQKSGSNGNVPEHARIHGCGVLSEGVIRADGGIVEAEFSRCVDTEKMLACSDWRAPCNWTIWTEKLPVRDLEPINGPAVIDFWLAH